MARPARAAKAATIGRDTRFVALIGLFFLVLAVRHARADTETPAVAALRDRVELAYQARDLAGIEAARSELRLAMDGPEGDRAGYFAAYASFRQGLLLGDDGRDGGRQIDTCIAELEGYVGRHPDDAEARALLGSCYGISTHYHRLAMASRGLEARKQMAAARALAPTNPWVMLQDGLADYATPRLFGGDPKLAIAKLEQATTLFANAMQAGSRLAAWGAAEAWTQLAQMYKESGRGAEAAVAAERAVALRRTGASRQLAAL
jgi:hypothetical protein